jgi:nitrate/nitrite-specific signal transduction histidine kinase
VPSRTGAWQPTGAAARDLRRTTGSLFGRADRQEFRRQQEAFRQQTLDSLLTQGGLALLLVGVAAVGFGWLMADRVLRPLHRITDTAARIAAAGAADRGLAERIAMTGPRDEIKTLADTFDSMLERLDRSFDGQRRFVANASHELRTTAGDQPALIELAVTRPDASTDTRQLGESLLSINARHERLIDGLLMLADSENAVTERTAVDLADVARTWRRPPRGGGRGGRDHRDDALGGADRRATRCCWSG